MVANDNEQQAAMHFLGSPQPLPKVKKSVQSYTCEGDKKLKNKIVVGNGFLDYVPITVDKIPGVVVRCTDIGSFRTSGSHRTTLQLVKNAKDYGWELVKIFIVGCCGTCPKTEEEVDSNGPPLKRAKKSVPIGTVLFAREIFQYAMGKLTDDMPVWIPTVMCCPPVNLKSVQYCDDASRVVKKVEPAYFLSGDFVVKGEKSALNLADIPKNQKYVGFEMEGVGATKATSDAEIFVPDLKMPRVVLIKGVSDKAGGDKNKPCAIQFFPEKPLKKVDEDSRQQMCTISSLTLVLRYIVHFPLVFTK